MLAHARKSLIVYGLFLLSGCAGTVTIESNVNKAYHGTVHSVFLSTIGVDKTDSLLGQASLALDSILKANGFLVQIYKQDPLALKEANYQTLVANSGADAALFILFKEGTSSGGQLSEGKFDVILYDKEMNTKIWRAKVDISYVVTSQGVASAWKPSGVKMAKTILSKMDADGVISLKVKIPMPTPDGPRSAVD